MSELVDDYQLDTIEIKKKFQDFLEEWKYYASCHDYQDNFDSIRSDIMKEMFQKVQCRLQHFEYSDRWSNRCGDYSGSTSSLATFLSYSEVRQKLRDYLEINYRKYCFHDFLRSLSDYGVYCDDDYGEFSGDIITSCQQISLDFAFSPQEKEAFIKRQKYAEAAKQEKERLEREAQERQRKLAEYERLKSQLGL